MNELEVKARLRKEQDILDRIENVKRLIQMETTLLTAEGARRFVGYRMTDRDGNRYGLDLLSELRDDIIMQLLSIMALCYGKNPDCGEPAPMLEWNMDVDDERHPSDKFWDVFEECLLWNA